MTETQIHLIRHIVQHHSRCYYNPIDEEYRVSIEHLNEEEMEAWNQLESDISCHILKQLVTG